jgi:chromosome partitioning protein
MRRYHFTDSVLMCTSTHRRIVVTVLNQPLPTPRAGIIIACMNQKGGVGKTTSAVNLCGEFAKHNLRVLLIDCDAQGNAATSLGVSKRDLQSSTYEIIMGTHRISQAIQPTRRTNFDIIPASERLSGVQVELVDAEDRDYRLAKAIEPVRAHYDIIMLDCPPALGFVSVNALAAANTVLVPLQCEFLALEGIAQLKNIIDRVHGHLNPVLSILGVVMTMYDGRTNLAQQVVDEVRKYFPVHICNVPIPRSVRASEAPSYGQLLSEYDPEGRATVAYAHVAQELLSRLNIRGGNA